MVEKLCERFSRESIIRWDSAERITPFWTLGGPKAGERISQLTPTGTVEVGVVSVDEPSYGVLGLQPANVCIVSDSHILNLALVVCGMNTTVEREHNRAS